MHEDYDYYMDCKYRNRNKGLFTADQVVRDYEFRDMFKCYSGMSNVFLNNTLFSGSQYTFLPFSSIATSTVPIDVEMGCGYMVTTLEREERRNMRSGANLHLKGESFFFCSVSSTFDPDCRYPSDDHKLSGQPFKK